MYAGQFFAKAAADLGDLPGAIRRGEFGGLLEWLRAADGSLHGRADALVEGVWGEVIFPSLGMWASTFRTPELLKACMRASNEWAIEEI